ncbi:uncharacterized protein LOC135091059 isoform X2 [Scylla paramamosain]|uniref:uncharacterized protein LOC135091059 isoform X2 n=1 Tax=Scylla paramamosain TaxID=85552 RepID=UPI003082DC42
MSQEVMNMPRSHITQYLLVTVVMAVVVRGAQDLTHPHTYDSCANPNYGAALHSQWDRIPANFTVKSSCLRVVIDELCKNNFPDVTPDDIGKDNFNRGILNCQGANCSIECIHQTYCNKKPDMEMPTESVAQEEVGFLQQTFNALPKCNRYLKGLNQTVFVKDAGYSCWGKLQCICGMCCESNTQNCFTNRRQTLTPRFHHYHHRHPLLRPPLFPPALPPPPLALRNKLRALLRLLPRLNLSNTKRMTVMRRMLDQTYKDLQAHLRSQPTWGKFPSRPSIPGHGTRAKPRVVAYARPGRQ